MTDINKEEKKPFELKPEHKQLEPGQKVFHGGHVYRDQVPESLVSIKDATGQAAPKKAAKNSIETGSPSGASGPAAPDKNK